MGVTGSAPGGDGASTTKILSTIKAVSPCPSSHVDSLEAGSTILCTPITCTGRACFHLPAGLATADGQPGTLQPLAHGLITRIDQVLPWSTSMAALTLPGVLQRACPATTAQPVSTAFQVLEPAACELHHSKCTGVEQMLGSVEDGGGALQACGSRHDADEAAPAGDVYTAMPLRPAIGAQNGSTTGLCTGVSHQSPSHRPAPKRRNMKRGPRTGVTGKRKKATGGALAVWQVNIRELLGMGYSQRMAEDALEEGAGDLDQAIHYLLTACS
jgi:hypothetical protein